MNEEKTELNRAATVSTFHFTVGRYSLANTAKLLSHVRLDFTKFIATHGG